MGYPEPGVYCDMPMDEYHDPSYGVSSSTLKHYAGTGAHAKLSSEKKLDELLIRPGDVSVISGERRKNTLARAIGDVVHCRVLEPDHVKSRYAIIPAGMRLPTKTQINAKTVKPETISSLNSINEFIDSNQGKVAIHEEDFDTAMKMAKNILSHHASMMLLKGSSRLRENSIFWWHKDTDPATSEEFSVMAKCRPDFLTRLIPTCPDIKTCLSADKEDFGKQALKLGYHISAGMYLAGINQSKEMLEKCGHDRIESSSFIAVENNGDHLVRILELHERDLAFGRECYRRLMIKYHRAQQNNHPGYSGRIDKLRLPAWKRLPEV